MTKYSEGIQQLILDGKTNEQEIDSLSSPELGTLKNEGVQRLIADGKITITDFKGLTNPELGTLERSACKQYGLTEPNYDEPNYDEPKLRGGMFRQEHENNSSRPSSPSFEA